MNRFSAISAVNSKNSKLHFIPKTLHEHYLSNLPSGNDLKNVLFSFAVSIYSEMKHVQ